MSHASLVSLPTAPDWNTISQTVLCPLCEYQLRGLSQPRCPECGYQFTWDEVLNADRRPHPYLFEHHPRQNVWSFARTKLGGFRPWIFWIKLKPTMPLVPKRLVLYWLINLPLLLILLLGGFIRFYANVAPSIRMMRTSTINYMQKRPTEPTVQQWVQRYGTARRAVDALYPDPFSFSGIQGLIGDYFIRRARAPKLDFAPAALLLILWPWATFATLMIFRISMARARIRPPHVLRCVVYSCDVVLIPVAALVFILPEFNQYMWNPLEVFSGLVRACLLMSALTLYKLGFAYRLYLRFPHAWTTVVVAQIVVSLAVVSISSALLFWY
jgi:hypothetical protein